MGRTSTARERLIDAAGDLLNDRGYTALGVAEICARADVRKGSFYHFFESKQALTMEAVDAQWASSREVWAGCLGGPEPGLDRVERLIGALVRLQCEDKAAAGSVRGCLFGNLALELRGAEQAVRDRVKHVFDEQVAMLTDALRAAESEGAIAPGHATPTTARAVLAQLEGMVLFAKLANDTDVLAELWPRIRTLLGAEAP